MKIVTLSSKNQVTIPKEALTYFGLTPNRKLLIEYKKRELILKPLTSSIVEETAGSLTNLVSKNKKNNSFKVILKETKRKTAKKLVKSL